MEALYKDTHPDYASYLYLMAPISLAILNPISFIFMEIGKQRMLSEPLMNSINGDGDNVINSQHKRRLKMVISVTKSIFMNPIIAMTILGILGNLIFKHQVPSLLGGILEV